ncbi:MAG: hypothetical protein RIC35_19675 [Marinoscillum sp.]
MKDYFIKIAMCSLFCCSSFFCEAQTVVLEDEVAFEILKWHFHHYPKSTTKQWMSLGEQAYRAEFAFDGKEVVTVYLSDGKRLSEEVNLTKDMPLSLTYYLEDKYSKYKVADFRKITNFSDEMVYYKMEVKSKEKGDETLSFDEDLIPIDFALISKAN